MTKKKKRNAALEIKQLTKMIVYNKRLMNVIIHIYKKNFVLTNIHVYLKKRIKFNGYSDPIKQSLAYCR